MVYNSVMALEIELQTYKDKLSELVQNEGKFVLIHGDAIIDFFEAYEDALKEGYKQFGLESFMVKRIEAVESIHFFTRFIPYPHRN